VETSLQNLKDKLQVKRKSDLQRQSVSNVGAEGNQA